MPLNALYQRDLIQDGDRWLIQSTCRICGHVVIGNVSEKLHDDEASHAEKCRPASTAASSSASASGSSSPPSAA